MSDAGTDNVRRLQAAAVASVRYQLDLDREKSRYWGERWANDGTDHAIEAWLDSLADWLGGAR